MSGSEELNMVNVCQSKEVSPTPCCCMPLDKSNTHAWVCTVLLTAVVLILLLQYYYVIGHIIFEICTHTQDDCSPSACMCPVFRLLCVCVRIRIYVR